MTLYEQIKQHTAQQWAPQLVDRVTQDLVDVATGTRQGSLFEQTTLGRIFPDSIYGGTKL
jgi:hypothetical protein